jgi:hypothetical protein
LWSAWGFSGAPLLVLAVGTTLGAWAAIARLPNLSGVLGVRPVDSPVQGVATRIVDTASTEGVA